LDAQAAVLVAQQPFFCTSRSWYTDADILIAMNHRPVRWGVLGAANIGLRKVIPAMQRGRWTQVLAIASRDAAKAQAAARELGIERAYGSYEALLADTDVEAIYIPLPNHMHVPWSKRAAEAGKHVLCEKPIALSATEARELLAVRDRTGVQIAEAFMVRSHPQWLEVHELIHSGAIGELRLITGHFSYFRIDPADIRSREEFGGGGLLDIGCYPIMLSRWLFGAEPIDAIAMIERDPQMGVDRLDSALLRFPLGHATFACGTQLVPHQRMNIFGTAARVEIEIPFNAPPDKSCRVFIDDGSDLHGHGKRLLEFDAVDQYTLQGDQFSRAVRGLESVAFPLEDAVNNMAVIDALFRSATSGKWEAV
jgi:predicted dehydrogenase